LPALIRSLAKPGDYIVFLGAGNITQWAHALPGQLAAETVLDAAVPA
jgi:UDP-N-acetylmuramate--alanine ligase